jgi:hypothetical protein
MQNSISKSYLIAIFLVASFLVTTAKPVSADTYQIFNLANDNRQFYGMDDFGTVVLSFQSCSLDNGGTCYETYFDGAPTGVVFAPPALTYDNGTPCTPAVPPGGVVGFGVCNNGRDAFTGNTVAGQLFPGVYVGSDPNITKLAAGGGGALFMNSRGDIVFDDAFLDEWNFALDTSTDVPEPGSLFLVGTGALGMLGALCRVKRDQFTRPVA